MQSVHTTPVILCVDDDETNQFVLQRILEKAGYIVKKAYSGQEGLKMVQSVRPDLIVLDIQLGDMSGHDVCRRLKDNAQTSAIPVLQVSANFISSEDKVIGLESGADGYLTQPLDSSVLVATAKALLRIRRAEQVANDTALRLKESQILLQEAKENAERANEIKSDFLANMSHEIRTPLGAILGFAELLKDEEVSEDSKHQFLEVIIRNGRALTKIIDDILDLSKVEAGKMEIEMISFSFKDLVGEVVNLFSDKAYNKGIEIQVENPQEMPEMIVSDQARLRQILINIVGNAVKFTSQGGVYLKISQEQKDSGQKLQIRVRDTGPGMTDEHQKRLFQPFTQGQNSVNREFGGTGLGLALSRRLARALKGDVTIENCKVNHGCIFLIEIALSSAQPSPHLQGQIGMVSRGASATERLKNLNILVVDDTPSNLMLITILLQKQGAVVTQADNGKDAIRLAQSGKFDIVLMDIQMPELDGREAVSILRRGNYKGPVIALTAHAMKEEIEKSHEAGFNSHVTKPIEKESLIVEILNHV